MIFFDDKRKLTIYTIKYFMYTFCLFTVFGIFFYLFFSFLVHQLNLSMYWLPILVVLGLIIDYGITSYLMNHRWILKVVGNKNSVFLPNSDE